MGYVAAIDSSASKWYGVVVAAAEVYGELIREAKRLLPVLHMARLRGKYKWVAINLVSRYASLMKLICVHVDYNMVLSELRQMLPPRTPRSKSKTILDQLLAQVLVSIVEEEGVHSVDVWYVDHEESRKLRQVGITRVEVNQEKVFPADVIAWLNNRGRELPGIQVVDATPRLRRLVYKLYSRR